jgi:hypothetical protein
VFLATGLAPSIKTFLRAELREIYPRYTQLSRSY